MSRCTRCGRTGHNRRTCYAKPKGEPRCTRCRRTGHKANVCLSAFPLVRTDDGLMTVRPELLVAVVTSRFESDGHKLSPNGLVLRDTQTVFNLLVYHGGGARVYVRDIVDARLLMAQPSGQLPWAECSSDLAAHFDAHPDGETAPIQLALPAATDMFSGMTFDIPTWTEEELFGEGGES